MIPLRAPRRKLALARSIQALDLSQRKIAMGFIAAVTGKLTRRKATQLVAFTRREAPHAVASLSAELAKRGLIDARRAA